jgi:hypothetical protein
MMEMSSKPIHYSAKRIISMIDSYSPIVTSLCEPQSLKPLLML